MRVFLDTHVWFAASATTGLCEALLKKLFETNEVLASELAWTEFADLLVRKLHFSNEEIGLARGMFQAAELVLDVAEPADDNDARLLAAARSAGADLFVTGDKRVPGWKSSGPVAIATPREAWISLFAPHLKH